MSFRVLHLNDIQSFAISVSCETIMSKRTTFFAKQAFAWKQDPVPGGYQNQPSRPNLGRSFRRRNVNRRSLCIYVWRLSLFLPPVEIACVISFAEVWPRSVSRHRKFQVVTKSAATSQRSKTIGCSFPTRHSAAITRLRVWIARTYALLPKFKRY